MGEIPLFFVAGVLLLLSGELSHGVRHRQQKCSVRQLSDLNNDFENSDGSLCPWIEESQGGAQWKIENYTSPLEPGRPAPQPASGSGYLRVNRGTTLSFGVAVLRSPTFTLVRGVNCNFSFSFWIQSKWPQFTNLELYLANEGNEYSLKSLSNFTDNNRKWQSQQINFKNDKFSSNIFSFVFYAYCGTDLEDAVAIDDIVMEFNTTPTFPPFTTSTTTPTSTLFTTSTTTTTSTPFTTSTPSNTITDETSTGFTDYLTTPTSTVLS